MPAQPESTAELDLAQIAGTLWRGKWQIAAYVTAFVLLGGIYAFQMTTPYYDSTSTVALHGRSQQVVTLDSVVSDLSGNYFTVATEVAVLRARNLIEKLVDELDLEQDPEFNALLKEPNTWSPGYLIGQALRAILPAGEPAPPPTPEEIRQSVVNGVLGRISVVNQPMSLVYDITVRTEDPEKSARLANTLADLYILDQIAVKYEATEQATAWLLNRLGELKIDLDAAESELKEFSRETTDLLSPEALEAMNRQLKGFRERLINAQMDMEAQARRAAALAAARETGDPAQMAEAAGDAALDQTLRRLSGGGLDAQAAFDARFDQILGRTGLDLDQARAQLAALQTSTDALQQRVTQQSKDLLSLQQLEREAEASRQIYEYFLNRLKETQVQQGVHQADSRVLSRATIQKRPASPNKVRILALFFMLGLMTGGGVVLLREIRHTGFRSAADLEQITGTTVIGQVPRMPFSRRRRVIAYLAQKQTSATIEAVRNLRTSLLLSNLDTPPQLIMTTSSVPEEGKTTLSLALAQSFASMQKRVLLIEGDVRRRTFREYFPSSDQPGLLSVVSGGTPFAEAVLHSDELGVDILFAEKSSVNATDFFSSQVFASFLDDRRADYDVVLIDTPPVLVVPDARVIGTHADTVIYVVKWDATSRAQVEEGLKSLANVAVNVTGLVLSQIDPRKARSYGGQYGELYYHYGYKNKYYGD